jgi:hypothetical protein
VEQLVKLLKLISAAFGVLFAASGLVAAWAEYNA